MPAARRPAARPAVKPARRPAARPAAQPAARKPAAQPAARKPAARPAARPAAGAKRPARPRAVGAAQAREWLLGAYGGFPEISGRKHSYPAQHERAKWVCLAQRALDWQRNKIWCYRVGVEQPARNSQFEYLLFHGRPDQIARRSKRNIHRKKLGAGPGDEVHHRDRRSLALSSAVVVSSKEHDRIHAAEIAQKRPGRGKKAG
jgi:hypothetical protein